MFYNMPQHHCHRFADFLCCELLHAGAIILLLGSTPVSLLGGKQGSPVFAAHHSLGLAAACGICEFVRVWCVCAGEQPVQQQPCYKRMPLRAAATACAEAVYQRSSRSRPGAASGQSRERDRCSRRFSPALLRASRCCTPHLPARPRRPARPPESDSESP